MVDEAGTRLKTTRYKTSFISIYLCYITNNDKNLLNIVDIYVKIVILYGFKNNDSYIYKK